MEDFVYKGFIFSIGWFSGVAFITYTYEEKSKEQAQTKDCIKIFQEKLKLNQTEATEICFLIKEN